MDFNLSIVSSNPLLGVRDFLYCVWRFDRLELGTLGKVHKNFVNALVSWIDVQKRSCRRKLEDVVASFGICRENGGEFGFEHNFQVGSPIGNERKSKQHSSIVRVDAFLENSKRNLLNKE